MRVPRILALALSLACTRPSPPPSAPTEPATTTTTAALRPLDGPRYVFQRIRERSWGIDAMRFSPDGRLLVISVKDELRVWDTGEGMLRGRLEVPWVDDFAFSSDMRTLVILSDDGEITLWDTSTLSLRATIEAAAYGFAIGPDGAHVLAFGEGFSRLWELASAAVVAELPVGDRFIESASFSPEGRIIATLDRVQAHERATLWDLDARAELQSTRWAEMDLRRVQVGPGADAIAVMGFEGLAVWRPRRSSDVTVLHEGRVTVEEVAFDGASVWAAVEDGNLGQLSVSRGGSDPLRRWSLGEETIERIDGCDVSDGSILDIDPLARRALYAGRHASVIELDTCTERVVDHHRYYSGLLERGGPRVLMGAPMDAMSLAHIDTGNKRVLAGGEFEEIEQIELDPTGERLFVRPRVGPLRVWAIADGLELERAISSERREDRWVAAFSPDGGTLVVHEPETHFTRLFDVATLELEGALRSWEPLAELQFCDDGRQIVGVSALDRERVTTWDLDTGATVELGCDSEPRLAGLEKFVELATPTGPVHEAMFLADGRTVVTSSTDVIELWDVASGQRRASVSTGGHTLVRAAVRNGRPLVVTAGPGLGIHHFDADWTPTTRIIEVELGPGDRSSILVTDGGTRVGGDEAGFEHVAVLGPGSIFTATLSPLVRVRDGHVDHALDPIVGPELERVLELQPIPDFMFRPYAE